MKHAILLARQRSGTGAVGSVLDQQPGLKYLGEVFHPDNLGQPTNFFTFFRDRVSADPEAALPDNRYQVYLDFLDSLSGQFPDQTLIVDIKYRSAHHLDGGWRGLVARPRSIDEAIANNRPILHLTRRNALHSFVSGRLAEANKVWHARDESQIKVTSTVLNIRQLSNYIVSSARETDLITQWTRNYPHLVAFDYDEAFDSEGKLDKTISDKLADLFGVEPFANRAPAFVKQAPTDMEQVIENYDLVRRALIGTEFKWMLG